MADHQPNDPTSSPNGAANASPNGAANASPPPPSSNGAPVNGHNRLPPERQRRSDLILNALLSRKDWLRSIMDPRRDLNDECGYPRDGSISPQVYQHLYDREAIAARVVEVMPRESWQVQPTVYEDEDPEVITPFEEAWNKLGKQLRGEKGWHKEESGSPIWEYLRRADELAGVGHFGIILLGFDDVENGDFAQPVKPAKDRKLVYLRVFPESLVQIASYDDDATSPRYGHPTQYTITFNSPHDQHAGTGLVLATRTVHWSRVIHIADVSHQASPSEVFAAPRMRPVLNRLLDLQKLYGGSAEMYWKGAFPGLSLETQPQLGGDVEINASEMKDMMEDYQNGLQRYLLLRGISANSLSPQVVDPSQQIAVQIEAICIKLGIPIRVFKGSERGELASSQDDAAWNDRLRDRQRMVITPRIICPFVDRLIAAGVLPEPDEGYLVWWPDLASQNESEKATVAVSRTQALVQYVAGGVDALLTPSTFLTAILGWSDEEAAEALEAAQQELEEKEAEEMAELGLGEDEDFGGFLTGPDSAIPPEGPNDEEAA